ncbi:MAG: sigma-E processing peptidase SpoIIGA [Clostridia bacterium]|nr:sigma-E processing peptidase SpoIIGA [Clostridia bacterium]
MGQTVYVDLLFLINFSMDFLCFFLCAKLLGRKLSLGRAFLSSAIGGIYANAALFISVGKLLSLLIDLLVCAVMCAVAFYKRGKVRSLPLYILVYFAISMALGGFMTAIFNLLNRAELPLEQGSSDGISVWMFALLAAVSALITLFGGRFFRKKAGQRNADIEITYRGKRVKLRGMSDSGNLLREPISGKPCIIADIGALEPIIPRRLTNAARKKDAHALGDIPREDAKNIRIVPIKTAGGEGILFALRADTVTLDSGKGAECVDALVALSDISGSADGNEALIPSELLI